MLCYRCGSHVPDGSEACGACGQKFSSGALRQTTGTFSRKKLLAATVDGAPYKPGDVLASRYQIKDVVGAGPVGFVFKAQDKEIDVEVALKVVSPRLVQTAEERKDFSREIRLGRKLSHNNIVRVYEDGEDQDRPFYTMQFLDGLTLRRIIDLRREKNQNFSLREVEPILAQICAGLDNVHKTGRHGDVKPENVIVLPDLLKLTDFGLAQAIPRQPFAQAQKPKLGHRYLAPEYLGDHEVDDRADVYAAGVILGEMLAGVFPDGSNIPELRAKNPSLPPAVESLYRRAVNENPASRFATAGELFDALAELVATEPPSAEPVRPEPMRPAPPIAPAQRPPTQPPRPASSSANLASALAPLEPRAPGAGRRSSNDSRPPPPPAAAFSEPAFVKKPATQPPAPAQPPSQLPRASARPALDETPVARDPRRAKHKKKSQTTLKLAILAVAGILAGLLVGWGYLSYVQRPAPKQAVGDQGPSPQPTPAPAATVADAGNPAADEAKKLEEQRSAEQKAAEARKAEEARQAEEQKLAQDKGDKAKAEQDARQKADEERKRKEALEKAFAAKPEPAKAVETAKVETAAIQPRAEGCPAGMKLIPAGAFKMGTSRDDPMMGFDEKPLAAVTTRAYCIDFFEFPNRVGAEPKVGVSYQAAEAACKARNRRLCTEEEWERACKGPGNSRFPYGVSFDAAACNTQDGNGDPRSLAASGTFARCRSAFGIADMSGNAAEWTSSSYGPDTPEKSVKGGASDRPDYDTRCASRKSAAPSAHTDKLGFRCCADP